VLESWEIDKFSVFVYCDEYKIVKRLMADFVCGTVYYNNGHPCGWQFRIPAHILRVLENSLKIKIIKCGC
jgi:hypothetical protein